jgi:hypothetical protein
VNGNGVYPQSTQMLSMCWFIQRRNTNWIHVLMGTLGICVFDTFRDFHHNAVPLSFGYETHHSLNAHIPATWSSRRRLSSWPPSFTLSLIPSYCLSYSTKDKGYSTKVTALKQLKEKIYRREYGNICITGRIGYVLLKTGVCMKIIQEK